MPATNGVEMQEQLRECSPDSRVIIITGREETALRAAVLERGAIAFLVKLFDDEAFLGLVRNALPEVAK